MEGWGGRKGGFVVLKKETSEAFNQRETDARLLVN